MNLREPGGAGRRLALVMTAAALALSTTACRVQLSAPHAATAPRADGGLEDWDSVPRRLVAGERLGLAAVQDDERLSLLLEGRDTDDAPARRPSGGPPGGGGGDHPGGMGGGPGGAEGGGPGSGMGGGPGGGPGQRPAESASNRLQLSGLPVKLTIDLTQ